MCPGTVVCDMVRKRGDSGEFVETITLDRVIAAIRTADGPFVTASDIAETLDCSTEAARQKLATLNGQGRVDRRKVGARAVVWWLTESNRSDTEIDPNDPLFNGGPIFASKEPIDETEIDDVLYGQADG